MGKHAGTSSKGGVYRLSKAPLEVVMRAVADLEPYARNARTHDTHQVAAIAASMREFGWTNPVLVDGKAGIIAGHGRVLAAKLLGLEQVPTIALKHLTEKQKRAYILADNKIALDADWDDELLRVELKDLGPLAISAGFTLDEIDRILAGGKDGAGSADAAPPPPTRAVVQPGEVWLLGAHAMKCGDATKPEDLRDLLGDQAAEILITDPPYNVNYGDKAEALQAHDKGHRNTTRILNDNMAPEAFAAFLRAAYTAIASVMAPGAPAYVFHGETERAAFTREFQAAGFYLSSNLIWRKNSLVLGRSDYHYQHEPILYGWREGGAHAWFGERDKTTILEAPETPFVKTGPDTYEITIGERVLTVTGKNVEVRDRPGSVLLEDKPLANDYHPTMKPVALLGRLMRNSSALGAAVLDPFGGSGSTLIASEQAGRRCFTLELEPKFADVICMRWQQFSGRAAVLRGTKTTFDERQARRRAA